MTGENNKTVKTRRTQQGSDTTNEESQSKASTAVQPVPKQRSVGPPVPPRQDLPINSLKSTPENRSEEDEDSTASQSKKRKKGISKIKFSTGDNGDDDDSPVQVLIPPDQLKLDNRESKEKSSFNKTPYENVLTEEQGTQETTAYSVPSSHPNDAQPLRSISYCQAHVKTPPLSVHRSLMFSALPNRTNTNDDSSHYSEITNDTIRSVASNASSTKNKQTHKESKLDNKIDIENQVEEEAGSQEENRPLISSQNPMPDPSDNGSTTNAEDDESKKKAAAEENEKEKKRILQRKRARTRWHLLYTLQRNYGIVELRKRFANHLATQVTQRAMFEEQLRAGSPTTETPELAERVVEFTGLSADET